MDLGLQKLDSWRLSELVDGCMLILASFAERLHFYQRLHEGFNTLPPVLFHLASLPCRGKRCRPMRRTTCLLDTLVAPIVHSIGSIRLQVVDRRTHR